MSQPTVFERNPALTEPTGRQAWQESFQPVLSELRTGLRDRAPEQIAAVSGALWEIDAGELHLDWLGERFRIAWPELIAYPAGSNEPCPANQQGLFLYYLSTADGTPATGTWIAFRELPDGWLYHQAFQGYTGKRLVQVLGNDASALVKAAKALGGTTIELGDYGFSFPVLPRVRLAIVYWQGDEEFPAQAQVLFDGSASHYLPIDGLALLGSDLVSRILREAS